MKNQTWKIVVSEKESGLVHETLIVDYAQAYAVMKGYESSDFYQVTAEFIR